MNRSDKMLDALEKMKKSPIQIVDSIDVGPDYHTMALLAAQTIPNQTVGELLASADKIEAWLRKPEEDCKKFLIGFKKEFEDFKWDEPFQRKQKSPEKLNPEASDGVNGD